MKNTTKKSKLKKYRLKSDNNPDLVFNGKIVAFATAYNRDHPYLCKRWTDISVYLTDTDKVVLYVVGRFTDEEDRAKTFVLDAYEEIPNHLYHSRLSADIYRQLGIEVVMEI